MDAVARHYGRGGLLAAILAGLAAQGKNPAQLSPDDLAAVDEFHLRGREATAELAVLAGMEADWSVVDLGSGLGGSSRFLASRYGCRVTGVDLTPEYCDAARELSRRSGLGAANEFPCASVTAMPFRGGLFDLAWTQHVQMNIVDKGAFYRETRRVLKRGGRFIFHDILAGAGGEPHYPAHWAEDASMSFLIAPGELRALLESSGFRVMEWRDTTATSRDWFVAKRRQTQEAGGPPPLGLHLLLGETARAKFSNLARNLTEERVTVYQGLLEAV